MVFRKVDVSKLVKCFGMFTGGKLGGRRRFQCRFRSCRNVKVRKMRVFNALDDCGAQTALVISVASVIPGMQAIVCIFCHNSVLCRFYSAGLTTV